MGVGGGQKESSSGRSAPLAHRQPLAGLLPLAREASAHSASIASPLHPSPFTLHPSGPEKAKAPAAPRCVSSVQRASQQAGKPPAHSGRLPRSLGQHLQQTDRPSTHSLLVNSRVVGLGQADWAVVSSPGGQSVGILLLLFRLGNALCRLLARLARCCWLHHQPNAPRRGHPNVHKGRWLSSVNPSRRAVSRPCDAGLRAR